MRSGKFRPLALAVVSVSALATFAFAIAAEDGVPVAPTPTERSRVEKLLPATDRFDPWPGKNALDPNEAKSFAFGIDGTPMGLPEFRSLEDLYLYHATCHGRVVLAKNLGSISFMNPAATMIHTRSVFKVLPGWMDSQRQDLPSTLSLFSYGGEVVEQGQTYRVFYEKNDGYLRDHDYLIELARAVDDSKASFIGYGQRVEVRDGRIYPQTGEWYGFRGGASLGEIARSVERVNAIRKCDQPPM